VSEHHSPLFAGGTKLCPNTGVLKELRNLLSERTHQRLKQCFSFTAKILLVFSSMGKKSNP
jgi:hypothetical protein